MRKGSARRPFPLSKCEKNTHRLLDAHSMHTNLTVLDPPYKYLRPLLEGFFKGLDCSSSHLLAYFRGLSVDALRTPTGKTRHLHKYPGSCFMLACFHCRIYLCLFW